MAPNIYLWFGESDFISITKGRYIHEFEIKTTVADFNNDFKKYRDRNMYTHPNPILSNNKIQYGHLRKHEVLNGTHQLECMPKKFYFAVPDKMIDPNDVPEYAGLIYVSMSKRPRDMPNYKYSVQKKAPDIFGARPIDDSRMQKIMLSLSYRFWDYYFERLDIDERSASKQKSIEMPSVIPDG